MCGKLPKAMRALHWSSVIVGHFALNLKNADGSNKNCAGLLN